MKDKQEAFDFPEDPKPRPRAEPSRPAKVPRESRSLCHYCGCMVPSGMLDRTPAVGNDHAWTAMAVYHGTDCRWIRTKGLRVDTDA